MCAEGVLASRGGQTSRNDVVGVGHRKCFSHPQPAPSPWASSRPQLGSAGEGFGGGSLRGWGAGASRWLTGWLVRRRVSRSCGWLPAGKGDSSALFCGGEVCEGTRGALLKGIAAIGGAGGPRPRLGGGQAAPPLLGSSVPLSGPPFPCGEDQDCFMKWAISPQIHLQVDANQ